MSVDDRQEDGTGHRSSPTGPRVAPRRQTPSPFAARPSTPPPQGNVASPRGSFRFSFLSIIIFVLLLSSIAIQAYRDLSQPGAWDFWRETYVAASMTSAAIPDVDIDGSGRGRRALAISGKIGSASASWLRDRLSEARLAPGDVVLLSSQGGALNQAAIMGEVIRSHGLVTAVATSDVAGKLRPAACASACVLVYAGGVTRYGIAGSRLGVHRFTTSAPVSDPLAEAQRIQGMVLGYMTKMGVSSAIVEAMSQTSDIRWLSPKEALALNLITKPVDRP
ncbi:COG3904 family protein [Bradyrhizobium sp. USDA 4454]